jgi:PAS domain S-box-containing protein
LQRQLAYFAAALALPILAFVAFVLASYVASERGRLESEAVSAAHTLAQTIDQEVLGLRGALDALLTSGDLLAGNFDRFHAGVTALSTVTGFNASLRDMNGRQILNTRRPFGASLPDAEVPNLREPGGNSDPRVVDLFEGQVSGFPLFGIQDFVTTTDGERYVLALTLPASQVRDLLVRAEVPPGWTIAVIDRNDRILARRSRHEEFVGEFATQDLRDATRGQRGTWEARTIDGQEVLGVYSRSGLTGWRVAIGIHQDELNAPVFTSIYFFTGIGLMTLILAGLLASIFGRRIARPVRALAEQARRLERGEDVATVETNIAELRAVGTALSEAGCTLNRREAELRASEARFRAIADTMPQMVWSTRPDGHHDYYNARWYEFTGAPEGTTDGEGWNGMFHPDDQERAWKRWSHSLATGEPYEIEYRLRHNSGTYRWVLGRALAVRDEEGRIERWFGTCTDIHEAKRDAEERMVVAQELSHRIKNLFSVLGSIVSLTARAHPQARGFADDLRARIGALGEAHNFVRPRSDDHGGKAHSTLKGLIAALTSAYEDEKAERILVEGDEIAIDEAAATPLALIFHELGTNAAKYGALSQDGGRIMVSCRKTDDVVEVDWKEHCVGSVPTISASGFGSRLIELSVQGQLGGSLERLWEEDGLRARIRIPLEALRRSGALRRQKTG